MEELIQRLQDAWESHRRLLIAGVALLVLAGGYLYQRGGGLAGGENAWSTAASSQSTASTSATSTSASSKVVVDVKGAVKTPGVYTLTRSARVQEAIAAAGGQTATADMRQVNLAKQLVDQQVVYVPNQGEQVATDPTATATSGGVGESSESEKINLNLASKEDLMKISGIGDKKADKILAYRQAHGQFKTIDELKNVDGFGDKTVAKLKEQLAV